jgi:hypothetical protein
MNCRCSWGFGRDTEGIELVETLIPGAPTLSM